MKPLFDLEQSRRVFMRRLALAVSRVGLVGAGACAQEGGGAAANAGAEAGGGAAAPAGPPTFELYHEEYGEGPPVVFATEPAAPT